MELVFKLDAIVGERGDASMTGASGIASLDDEAGDETVEDRIGVVPIEAVLEEISRREWCLFSEKFEEEVTRGGVEDNFGGST